MPGRKSKDAFSFSGAIATAFIGLGATLIATGLVSTISLYTRVATLTDDLTRTEQLLNKHLDHAVDRDDYLRRDSQIQKAIDAMATKEDLRLLRAMILDLSGDPKKAEQYRATP
jgi:hypothetical protein